MKKIFNLFLLIFISLASLFSSSFNITKNTFNSNYHITQNTDLNKNDFDENKHVTWGGHALRYFLYKNSSASYIEEHRNEYDKLVKALIDIGLENAPGTIDNLDVKNKEFKYTFLSSAIVVSKYGSTEPEEFFAESFSRYISSNDKQKNTTYYLLDHFFNNTFQKLKSANLGGILDDKKWEVIEEIINEDFKERHKKDNFFGYDIFLKNTNLSSQELGYEKDKDFGFFSPKYITSTLKYITLDIYKTYTRESFLSKEHIPFFDVKPWEAAIEISENELSKIKFDKEGTLETISKIRSMLKSFANAQLYNPFKDKKINKNEETITYKNFDELNNHWKKKSLFNFKLHSAINLEKTINNLDNKTFLDQNEWFSKDDLKKTLVKLFNKVEQITNNRFKDIFINLIITNHKTIDLGKRSSQGVNGVTLTRISDNDKKSPIFSYVVIRTKSFIEKDTKESFLDSWFSSNHVFQTVNHEFGHILDYFLAQTEEQAKANKKSFNEAFWARHQPRNLYSSDKSQSRIINLKIVLFISLIIVSSSSIVALIFIIHKRKKH
ncbi:Hypothetical protein, predicted transmembrane protein [Mycoplasma yeatsii 13926]|uniref:Transmembrane protein n=1 Tax=Mycoplasma yeatsii 13926 TaxID=1188240 RepID=S6G433_9MOLU|nr:hypothetical protein [Mycoplasma yeatsii]EOA07562.1 Hypothetical protein, predicted transmembrane protein [Mycoplasma yeatsii 13926]